VNVVLGDAREILLTLPGRYDVVFSEPSNPYRAGVASLFTREYYAAVAQKLADGGLFVQWLQTYEIDKDTIRAVYATLGAVFPHVETWRLGVSDLALVASSRPFAHDAAALRARVASEPYARALSFAWRAEGLAGLFAHHLARAAASANLAAGGRVNTDDMNHVEFAFARHVGNFARLDALFEFAKKTHEDRPELLDEAAAPSWAEVDEERIMQLVAEGYEPDIPPGLPVDLEVRAQAGVNYVAGNLTGALAKWEFQQRAPVGATELALVAESLAEKGSDDALALIVELRKTEPVEADAMLARLHLRQGKRAEAVDELARAFEAYRRDPWPQLPIMHRALDLVVPLAEAEPTLAPRLLDVLREPFAVGSLEIARLVTKVQLARQIPDAAACAAAWHDLEPWVPWDADALTERRDCYHRAKDPRSERARRDLADFLACGASPSWIGCL
jgi:hypothetical protein